jgi:hypothetical protein
LAEIVVVVVGLMGGHATNPSTNLQ